MSKNKLTIAGILAGAVLAMLFVADMSGHGMRESGILMASGMNGLVFMLLFWLIVASPLITLTFFLVTQSQKR